MGYLKKFTDIGAGIAAAHGLVYLIREFMIFKPEDVEGTSAKMKLFLSKEARLDYRSFWILVVILLLSALVGQIFRKCSPIPLVMSLFSFTFVIYMFQEGKLYERPMLFILLGGLQVIGNYVDTIQRDRQDGRHRTWLLANLTHLYAIFFCFYVLSREKKVADIPTMEMKPFDVDVYLATRLEEDFSRFLVIAILCAVCILVSLLLKDLYFVDAILSLIPFGYMLFLWYTKKITAGPVILLTLLLMAVIVRVELMLAAPPDEEMRQILDREAAEKEAAMEPETSEAVLAAEKTEETEMAEEIESVPEQSI